MDDLIGEAAAFLAGRVRRTPVEYSRGLSDAVGAPVWLKLESMQLTGSFKIRGALFRISKLTAEERREGVITCSAGNHGLAVAYAARQAGVRATVCVPRSVDGAKLEGMVALGASVRISEFDGYDDTEEWSREIAAAERLTFISAFDDYAIMAANGGTVAMEAIDDVAEARTFVLPVGGGGLSAGFASHAKARLADSIIIGCQHVLSPALRMSFEAGRAITRLPAAKTLAGGIEGGIGALAFAVLQSRIDRVALVSEDEILEGVRWMAANHQYLIEPTAAVTIAATLTGKIGELTKPAVVVVSGRNVSAGTLKTILCRS
ncbi:MAG TPA: pyridoxal-phosphate dependent enzyme [Bryobacteraceae bacterium]|nr:pyridoxal-phosphate dependent enzyme [Bryobacteraceae bacterium]